MKSNPEEIIVSNVNYCNGVGILELMGYLFCDVPKGYFIESFAIKWSNCVSGWGPFQFA